jgi:outer membrane protein OmpA-like peptidoglycan-associated protein
MSWGDRDWSRNGDASEREEDDVETTPQLSLQTMRFGQRVLQRRATRNGAAGRGAYAAAERGVAGAGAALPQLDAIQASFGHHDVRGVQAFTDGTAARASAQLGAEAYALGDRVAFDGTPSLHTAAHEAAHVVQQRAGVSLKDGDGQSDDAYERHADRVADQVVRGGSAASLLDEMAPPGSGGGRAVQRKGKPEPPPPGAEEECLNRHADLPNYKDPEPLTNNLDGGGYTAVPNGDGKFGSIAKRFRHHANGAGSFVVIIKFNPPRKLTDEQIIALADKYAEEAYRNELKQETDDIGQLCSPENNKPHAEEKTMEVDAKEPGEDAAGEPEKEPGGADDKEKKKDKVEGGAEAKGGEGAGSDEKAAGGTFSVMFNQGSHQPRNFDQVLSDLKGLIGTGDKKKKVAVELQGFASSEGADDFNKKLSKQRADAVAQRLRALQIVSEEEIEKIEAFGEEQADQKSANPDDRRVDIIVTPKQ